jgi:YfiH family protein
VATPFLLPHWPQAPANIGALTTLRGGGVSPAPYGDGRGGGGLNLGVHVGDQAELVRRNRYLLQGVLPVPPAWLTQVHGGAVLDAAALAADAAAPEADASFASARGAVCAILTADCLPVLFCDVDGKVVAAAHAGWRGLAGGVLENTLRAMRGAGAGEILAWLGPAIGPGRFEVGADVLQAFRDGAADAAAMARVDAAFVPIAARPGKYLADMDALARNVLRRAGVERVAGGEFCTVSEPARFYSYRRDGVTGRQASLIWRK